MVSLKDLSDGNNQCTSRTYINTTTGYCITTK